MVVALATVIQLVLQMYLPPTEHFLVSPTFKRGKKITIDKSASNTEIVVTESHVCVFEKQLT